MPAILEQRKAEIMKSNPNYSESRAYAIATSQLQREGKLRKKKKK